MYSDNDLLILYNGENEKVVFLNCFAADNALLIRDPVSCEPSLVCLVYQRLLINRNILLFLVQKLFIIHISGATCQREMQLQFCEGDSHTLSCAHFSKNISILSANYGRLTGAQVCGWGPIKTTHCKADGALAKVQAHCQGRSHCTLRATNSEFGDPCDETYKYLEVTIFLSQTFSQLGFKGISFVQFLVVARIRSFGKFIDLEKEVVA